MHLPSGGIGFCLLVATSLGTGIAAPAAAFEINEDIRVQQLAMLPPLRPPALIVIDNSGRRQQGQASYYAKKFDGRKMANGEPLRLTSNAAASKSLPLGTVARVTNIKNGRSAVVEIQDRGPFRQGGVVDLTPSVASQLGLKRAGLAPVIVSPISIPQTDGSVKLGAGAAPHYRKFDAAEAARLKKAKKGI
jgi:rare lipoprotein A